MKGIIPTTDIAKILHLTPYIEGRTCPTLDTQLQKDVNEIDCAI